MLRTIKRCAARLGARKQLFPPHIFRADACLWAMRRRGRPSSRRCFSTAQQRSRSIKRNGSRYPSSWGKEEEDDTGVRFFTVKAVSAAAGKKHNVCFIMWWARLPLHCQQRRLPTSLLRDVVGQKKLERPPPIRLWSHDVLASMQQKTAADCWPPAHPPPRCWLLLRCLSLRPDSTRSSSSSLRSRRRRRFRRRCSRPHPAPPMPPSPLPPHYGAR